MPPSIHSGKYFSLPPIVALPDLGRVRVRVYIWGFPTSSPSQSTPPFLPPTLSAPLALHRTPPSSSLLPLLPPPILALSVRFPLSLSVRVCTYVRLYAFTATWRENKTTTSWAKRSWAPYASTPTSSTSPKRAALDSQSLDPDLKKDLRVPPTRKRTPLQSMCPVYRCAILKSVCSVYALHSTATANRGRAS